MDSYTASLMIALRGLDERQRKLLTLAAHARGTYYADAGLKPWWPNVARNRYGQLTAIPCHERAPGIRLGILGDKVRKMLDCLCGEGKMPGFQETPDEVVRVVVDELELTDASRLPTWDVIVKGSSCDGFSRLPDGSFEPTYCDPVFCTPVFASMARTETARLIRDDVAKLGVQLTPPSEGDALFVPDGSRWDDLIALRYDYTWLDDENVVWRRRRDFFPNVTLDYNDVRVTADQMAPPNYTLKAPPDPHNFGIVPLVWTFAPDLIPGDLEGQSLLTDEVISIAIAADYAASLRDDATRSICWPQLTLIDVVDKVQHSVVGDLMIPHQQSGSGTVMEFRSNGNHPEVKITEPNGTGLAQADKEIEDLRHHAERITGLIEQDPNKVTGALSGVALEKILEPKIAAVNRYRRSLGRRITRLALKVGHVIGQDASAATLQWPRVVSMTPADLQAAATALGAATGGKAIISRKTAVTIFANLAEIQDPEGELALIEEEEQLAEDKIFEQQSQALKMQMEADKAKADAAGNDPNADPSAAAGGEA